MNREDFSKGLYPPYSFLAKYMWYLEWYHMYFKPSIRGVINNEIGGDFVQ